MLVIDFMQGHLNIFIPRFGHTGAAVGYFIINRVDDALCGGQVSVFMVTLNDAGDKKGVGHTQAIDLSCRLVGDWFIINLSVVVDGL